MFRGGESQKSKALLNAGYSDKAQCTGNTPSYLEPNSQSLQKTIEGVYRVSAFRSRWQVRKVRQAYLEPIRNSMQIPIEGLSKNVGDRVAIGEKTAH